MLAGVIGLAEAREFAQELQVQLARQTKPFGTVIDIRSLVPPEPEVAAILTDCESITKQAGLKRRAMVVRSPVIKAQARQVAHQSLTADQERYIDAARVEDWERVAIDWVEKGIEPPVQVLVPSSVSQA
jgi:hypothetical protein